MAYKLQKISDKTANIFSGRTKIGHAVLKADNSGNWYGAMQAGKTRVEATGSLTEVFNELVAKANRIALCGEDNQEKARAALAARNAETERRNAEARAASQPIFDDINRVAADLGIPVRFGFRRPRSHKIRL